jgi:hypothetical protein
LDDQRKKIIISEIKYWKQNRMLPAHYCDFLLNLYTEGSSGFVAENNKSFFQVPKLLSLFLLGLLSLSVFLFYFTELSLILQIVLIIIFGICSLISGGYLLSKSRSELIPLLAASLILLITTVQTAIILFSNHTSILYAVTILNCLLWLFVGVKWSMISFKISGVAGILIIFITIFI